MMMSKAVLGILLVCGLFASAPAGAQTFTVDFSRWSGPPLIKTKFGVYQTPLIRLPGLLNSTALLREINVQNLRYEMGWGKPESLAFDQIAGTPSDLKIDFSTLDQFAAHLTAQDVRPLFAMTYCPNPLKSREVWPAWKDLPSDLAAWQSINQRYAAHLSLKGADYEIWNEPDINDPGGKMFFSGGPADYQRLYHSAASGIRQGEADALVGGAAVAYDLNYFTPLLSEPLDFASIHAYDNYAAQVGNLRGALNNRPDLPIFLTEYASFTSFGKTAPVSRFPAAMRFFRDAKGMLALPDVTRVYWAQWVDDNLGLLTADGHRKALFNAFKIYGMMPVDRNAVSPDGADGVNLLASSDDHHAAVVLWNENAADRAVTINLTHLPFARGSVQEYRIDHDHASYIDNPASEDLRVLQTSQCRAANASWTGTVPGESIVFLKISDGQAQSRPTPPGRLVRNYGWFWDRSAPAYADFDPHTFIGRVGLGDRAFGIAQIGGLIDNPVQRLIVQVRKSGPFASQDANSLFGLRLDFPDGTGRYVRSVLYHDRLYNPRRNSPLPWGKGGATPDRAIFKAEMDAGRSFSIDLAQIAPPNWNHKRVLLSFILQNAGRDSQVISPTGKVEAQATTPVSVSAAGQEVAQQVTVARPLLWSIETPRLYRLHTEIQESGRLVDAVDTPFGIRTLRYDANLGFFLNGKSVKIKGTCNHQDFAGVGVAVPDSLEYWRVKTLKAMGANAWRMSHNPPTPELLDACDKLGMLVMDENRHLGDTESGKAAPNTPATDLSEVKSVVLRDRNHPGIIMWSLCNEEGIQGSPDGARIGLAMKKAVDALDGSRPVTAAMNGGHGQGLSTVLDLEGFNYSPGSYAGYHRDHPDHPLFGSETASAVTTRGIYSTDKFKRDNVQYWGEPDKGYVSAYDVNAPGWAQTTENAWRPIAENAYVAGGFVWTGFDYKGEPTPYGWPCINSHFGILDMCGFPKDNYYYYKAWWGDKPSVHILPHWNWAGKEGQSINVWVQGNPSRVDLFLNGTSLGAKDMPRNGHLEWSVPYAPGTLEARGYDGGGKLIAADKVETAGSPAALRLSTDRTTLTADGEDVTMIDVAVVDAQGRVVPTADNRVAFQLTGAGHIAGVGNGDPSDHDPDKAANRRAFNGLCLAVVQTNEQPGDMRLMATAPGLKGAAMSLRSQTAPGL